MIKYIGSKRVLIPNIQSAISSLDEVQSVFDVFSGTARVGHAVKASGRYVVANDYNEYATTLARCYVESNADELKEEAESWIARLNKIEGKPGYFTKTFCEESRYFQPKNGARVDAIRDEIQRAALSPALESILLTSLMEAADRVDSTTGVQMAYLKKWAARANNDLEMRLPAILSGDGKALNGDSNLIAKDVETDLAYIDPPYNQHSYLGNYHIWETLVKWDKPEYYGVACKRTEVRERKSDYNSKRRIDDAFRSLIETINAKHLVVSFNNEGYLEREAIENVLRTRGYVGTVVADFKRYVGAQIGIHNLKGEKVGKVTHLKNKEYIFFVSDSKRALETMIEGSGLAPVPSQLALGM